MTAPPAPPLVPANAITYVVVVHGMGEAREHETVLPVIERLAAARRARVWKPDSVLSLGNVAGHRDLPWSEYEGLPRTPPASPLDDPFIGARSTSGDNLRFVDAHWSDLLTADWTEVGQDPEPWATGLLGRVRRKDELARNGVPGHRRAPVWATFVLDLLVEAVVLVHLVLRFRFKDWDELIFGKYLGDVQLYGEHARSRQRAVARFHVLMHRVLEAHRRIHGEQRPYRVIVVAHSLGTVMALDALATAYARHHGVALGDVEYPGSKAASDEARAAFAAQVERRRFPEGDYPDVTWIDRVESFVTLGSPIDKFLVLWDEKFAYLEEAAWLAAPRADPLIRHFNYCEDQDPVGHDLNRLQSVRAYPVLFECSHEKVYVRSAIPGLAHIQYWKDQDLWTWILRRVVDRDDQAPAPRWFDVTIYRRILTISYTIVPWVLVGASFAFLATGVYADAWYVAAAAGVALFLSVRISRRVIDLLMCWRQLIAIMRKDPEAQRLRNLRHGGTPRRVTDPLEHVGFAARVRDVRAAPLALVPLLGLLRRKRPTERERITYARLAAEEGRPYEDVVTQEERRYEECAARVRMFRTMLVWLALAGVAGAAIVKIARDQEWFDTLRIVRVVFVVAVALLCRWLWHVLFVRRNVVEPPKEIRPPSLPDAAPGAPAPRTGKDSSSDKPQRASLLPRAAPQSTAYVLLVLIAGYLPYLLRPRIRPYGWLPDAAQRWAHVPDVLLLAFLALCLVAFGMSYRWLGFTQIKARLSSQHPDAAASSGASGGVLRALWRWLSRLETPAPPAPEAPATPSSPAPQPPAEHGDDEPRATPA